MECMCQECGMSVYHPRDIIQMADPAASDVKLIDTILVCQECGGQLALIGRAGDEPRYRLK